MADRCQAIQRNLYTTEASQFRPDFKRNYGDDYIRGLSFVGTDVPQHARNTQYTHFYDSLHPNSHVEKDLGRTGGSIVPRNRQQRDMNMIPSRGMGKTQSLADTIYMGTDSLTQRRSPSPKVIVKQHLSLTMLMRRLHFPDFDNPNDNVWWANHFTLQIATQSTHASRFPSSTTDSQE
jgi:hypothetical protein